MLVMQTLDSDAISLYISILGQIYYLKLAASLLASSRGVLENGLKPSQVISKDSIKPRRDLYFQDL